MGIVYWVGHSSSSQRLSISHGIFGSHLVTHAYIQGAHAAIELIP
jgi:hypothetical protein